MARKKENADCSCEDKPEIRGNSKVGVGGRESYVLASPLQRRLKNAYDCTQKTGTEWTIEGLIGENGGAEVRSPGSRSCKVKGLAKGRVKLTVTTVSQCKCRPDGHKVDCTTQTGEKIIRIV